MSFVISTRAELIKTKRSASFWVCVLGSGFIPLIFLLTYTLAPSKNYPRLQAFPWGIHFGQGWQAFSSFLLPMFVILICSLIPQIEYKNNAWKQVFASPQSLGNIFFSKFFTIHLMILFLFLLFTVFMIGSAVVSNLIISKYVFLKTPLDWVTLWKLNYQTYLSILGMSAIQYWLSLRFKNFIASIGIGLAFLITSLIAVPFWKHVDTLPYAYPILTMKAFASPLGGRSLPHHEIYSILYFAGFILLAFLDMKYKKERG
jgi:lantibiotic transport system permease protein